MATIEVSSSASFESSGEGGNNSVQQAVELLNVSQGIDRLRLPTFGTGRNGFQQHSNAMLASVIRNIKCGYLRDSIVRNVIHCFGEEQTRSLAAKYVKALEQ